LPTLTTVVANLRAGTLITQSPLVRSTAKL